MFGNIKKALVCKTWENVRNKFLISEHKHRKTITNNKPGTDPDGGGGRDKLGVQPTVGIIVV